MEPVAEQAAEQTAERAGERAADVELRWGDAAASDESLADELHRVVAAVAALGGAVGWLHVPDRAEVRRWYDGVLASGARVALTRRAGRLEALGLWQRYDAAVLARNAEVRKLMVHPDARGGGLARRTLLALVADARRAGIETLVLQVRGNNHGAMALYEAVGFEVAGRLPDFIAVGDERFDGVTYRLDLRGDPEAPDAGRRLQRHGGRREGPGAS